MIVLVKINNKKCSKCKKEKNIEEFYKNKVWCKECESEYKKEWYNKNKNKIIKKQKERYRKNREYLINYQKNYTKENKKKISKQHKNWAESKALYNLYFNKIDWVEKIRKDPENKKYLQVKCTNSSCKIWFNPSNREVINRINVLNSLNKGESRFYCSEKCKKECSLYYQIKYPKGLIPEHYKRFSQKEWADLVKERDNYTCIKCGRSDLPLIAHHIEGLNVNPIESADIDIGITLCTECDREVHSEIECRYVDLRKENLCKENS